MSGPPYVHVGDVLKSHWKCRDYTPDSGDKAVTLFREDEIFVVVSVTHPTECMKDFVMLGTNGPIHWPARFRPWTDFLKKMHEVDDGCK